jgi:hypothetical protein
MLVNGATRGCSALGPGATPCTVVAFCQLPLLLPGVIERVYTPTS